MGFSPAQLFCAIMKTRKNSLNFNTKKGGRAMEKERKEKKEKIYGKCPLDGHLVKSMLECDPHFCEIAFHGACDGPEPLQARDQQQK